jgi:hypothetical protein
MLKARSLFQRALDLQGDIYDFRNKLQEIGFEDLAQEMGNAAFEMDLTWNNAEKVAKKLKEMYANQ